MTQPASEDEQRSVFLEQARSAAGRSPLYEKLCRHLAADARVAAIIGAPRRDSPLRLLAGLHLLVLQGKARWDDVDTALDDHADFLRRFVSEQGVQTNEVQRCWMLLPCFLEIVRRAGAEVLDVIELGCSAGLNLNWNRYRYHYAASAWGEIPAPLELRGEERGAVPAELLRLHPQVRSHIGIDRAPIDTTTPEGRLLLHSFVWPDQRWRRQQLDQAIAAAGARPPRIVRGDIAEMLPQLLQRRSPDSLTLVWQTAALSYLPAERRQLVYESLDDAGRKAPLAFVETALPGDASPGCYGLFIRLWPEGERLEVARGDFHGAWIDWLA